MQSRILVSAKNVLYVSGEESIEQLAMRFNRLKLDQDGVLSTNQTSIEKISSTATQINPSLLVVDSIQTSYHSNINATPGSILQLREVCFRFLNLAKETKIPIILIGHVTKDGEIAGPKFLEHMFDAVLYFESYNHSHFRFLRPTKNRFGPTDEVGVFVMKKNGLEEVENLSSLFMPSIGKDSHGSILTAFLDRSRVFCQRYKR